MSKVMSFRGLLDDGSFEKINLHTPDGSTGYRIVKFQAIPEQPGLAVGEHIVKIYKTENNPDVSTPTDAVNFGDNTLLGVVAVSTHSGNLLFNEVIIFDQEIFNQDIFITHVDRGGSAACNFFIELEPMKLDLNENTVTTLRDIRNTNSQ